MRNEIYQQITDRIISKLEQGVIPWQKPWHSSGLAPRNIKGRPYRGINPLLLDCENYKSPFWLTFNQAKDLGGNIKKGEKSTMIVFWKMMHKTSTEEVDGEIKIDHKKFPYLRYYRVFNLEQTENIPLDKIPTVETTPEIDFSPIEKAEQIIAAWDDKPQIKHGGSRAFYRPMFDQVNMPEPKHFISKEHYYSVLFHEYVHATGHETRTARHKSLPNHSFGSRDYSIEELVAEMGAAFLCGITGVENDATAEMNAAYVQSWIGALKNDNRLLLKAASLAQKACDYIAPPDFEEKEESAAA